MSLRSKLLFSIVMVAIATLLFAVLTVGLRTNTQVRGLVSNSVANRLVALREVQKERVENYFLNTFKVVNYTAQNPATITAMENFAGGFSLTPKVDDAFQTDLTAFYSGPFIEAFQGQDSGFTQDQASNIVQQLDVSALFHQTRYLARNEYPIGEKSELVLAPKEGKFTARYEVYHTEFHPIFKQVRDQFEFVDVYLIDETGRVVYSVEKNIDYATSLAEGPFAGSSLGALWQQAQSLAAGEAVLSDYESYLPSFSRSVAFVATPIVAKDKRLGTLIVQLDNSRLTQVMTSKNQWSILGLGQTGEAYLVGEDHRLRSQARGLLEDASVFFNRLTALGNQPDLNIMTQRLSSVGLLQTNNAVVDQALQGKKVVTIAENYLDTSVLSTADGLQVQNNRWVIVVEMAESEVFNQVDNILRQALIYAVVVLLVAVVLSYGLGVLVSRMIISPLKNLVGSFHNIAEGDGDLSVQLNSAKRNDEIGNLSVSFNNFVKNIHDMVRKVVVTAHSIRQVSTQLAEYSKQNSDSVHRQRTINGTIVQTIGEFTQLNRDIIANSSDAQQAMERVAVATENGRKTSQRCEQEMQNLGQQSALTVKSIQVLSDEIESISQIVATINGISEQTSLLALNAAIEAARAGEQGRGFAVVADEVRSLSSRTQLATVDIQKKIAGLGSAADQAVKQVEQSNQGASSSLDLVKETAEELAKVQQIVSDMRSLSDAIDRLASQQDNAVKGIENSVNDVQAMTAQALESTAQVNKNTQDLLETSNKLAGLVSRFKTRD